MLERPAIPKKAALIGREQLRHLLRQCVGAWRLEALGQRLKIAQAFALEQRREARFEHIALVGPDHAA